MKSPTYSVHPVILDENNLIPCDEADPNKIGYSILMQHPSTSAWIENGHLYETREMAESTARDLGTITVRENHRNGYRDRTEHFCTARDIMTELSNVGDEDGFGSTHTIELWWGSNGRDMHRQWILTID